MTSDPDRLPPSALRAVVRQGEIRTALQDGQMVLHYLPIIDLSTGRPRGAEALIRWKHPQGGLLPPDDFLPAVAHTPVMREVTRWVLDEACREVQRWPQWVVSVNVAARDVTDPGLPALVSEALARHRLDPRRLILELTEHAVVSDLALATRVLGDLRELGVGLSLDDFGTGYSSLLYLRELPLTEIKIDRVFVQHLIRRADDAAIVESVIRLGRSVGLEVVAEGVASVALADRLHDMGCGSAQGFLWGRPASATDISAESISAWLPGGTRTRRNKGSAPPLAADLARRIETLLHDGASLHTIAAALNSEGLRTTRGMRWHATSVAQVVASLPPLDGARSPS